MDCKSIQEKLSCYLDGYSDNKEKQQIESHLQQCALCAQEFEEMKHALISLRQLPEIDIPLDFQKELNKKLLEENKKMSGDKISFKEKVKNRSWLSWGATAAVVVFMLLAFDVLGFFSQDLVTTDSSTNQMEQMDMPQEPALDTEQDNKRSMEKLEKTGITALPEQKIPVQEKSSQNIPPEKDINEQTFQIMSSQNNLLAEEAGVTVTANLSADIEVERIQKAIELLEELARNSDFKNIKIEIADKSPQSDGVTVYITFPKDTLQKLLDEISTHYKLLNLKQNESFPDTLENEDGNFSILELHLKNSA